MSEIYIMTEIGLLPNSWEVVSIDTIAEVKGGKRLPKGEELVELRTNHPYIRVTDMYMGGVLKDSILYVPEKVFPSISRYTISKDDIFISVAGTLGLVGFIPPELDGANLTENADKITNIKIDRRFLFYVLSSSRIQEIIRKESTNNAQPKLALTRIKEFLIPKPKLSEQKKIAEILFTLDSKINVIEEHIKTTEKLKKGLMQQLLTKGIGHTKFKDSPLGEIPEGWEIVNLEFLIQEDRGITYGIVQPGPFDANGRYLVRGKDYSKGWAKPEEFFRVSSKIEEPYKRARLKENDLITTIVGAGVGNMHIVPKWLEGANITQTTARIAIDIKKGNFRFFFYVLSSQIGKYNVRNFEKGGAQPGLNLADIKKYLVPLPPLSEQNKIAEIFSSCDEKLDVLQAKKENFQELKKGLMQQLLTGKIRVKYN